MENSALSLKISLCKIVEIKICGKTRFENLLKQLFALVGYEVIITNSRHALVGYFITSYPTRAHGIIVIYVHVKWRLLFIYNHTVLHDCSVRD